MYRESIKHGANPRRGQVARRVLATALAGGLAIGGMALAAPAFAKDKQEEPKKPEGNSKAFADAYQPMMKIINDPAGDFAAAKAMIPTVQPTIQNDADKYSFGNALIALGGKLQDISLQKQGVALALESGRTPAAQVGVFHYYLGKWAYGDKNYEEARTQLQQALQAGYTDNDPEALIAETYFGQGQGAQGLQYLADLIQKRTAAGQQVPDNWYRRGLKVAYEGKLAPQADTYAEMLVRRYPTPENWQGALQVINAVGQLDAAGQVDLFRLMQDTGALKDKHDYYAFVEADDPRSMSNEVLAVLDQGVKSGVLSTSDAPYQEAKPIADGRAAADKSAAASIESDARKSATGKIAMGAGDDYFSFGAYDKAAAMYQLALDKGVTDRDLALMHLGIAQARAGQLDAAKAAFQQVTGPRAPIARMWLAYVAVKTSPPSPPAPPAPPSPPA